MPLSDSTKDMPLTPQPKKRRSALAGVKELGALLAAKRQDVDAAAEALTQASQKHSHLLSELRALGLSYDLVKPQPRQRKGKS